MYFIIKKSLFLVIGLFFQAALANNYSLNCSFYGLKKNEKVVNFGSIKKQIDSKFDFTIEIPKSNIMEWAALLEGLEILGSVDTPKVGWVGLAYSSKQKPNDGWASVKLVTGAQIILTRTSGDQTIQSHCSVE